jgi:hypothetical protein
MTPLTITLPPEVVAQVAAGEKKIISTKRNPRKDRYFLAKTPDIAKINGMPYRITRIEGTPEEWRVHLGKIIETSGCPCKHPPDRLYAWTGRDAKGPFTCVVCCRCGDVLKGNAAHFEK